MRVVVDSAISGSPMSPVFSSIRKRPILRNIPRGTAYMSSGRTMKMATQAIGILTMLGSSKSTYVTICRIRHHIPAK